MNINVKEGPGPKYLVLVCEGLTDDPIDELGDRTPLEVARTPHLDALAARGVTGAALFVPRSGTPVSADVACFSILGFDPREYYTGLAPLEALAIGVPQSERDVAFRCDLVTALDDTLVDTSASRISHKESHLLITELNEKLSGPTVKFHAGKDHKNILIVSDPALADALDDLECEPPSRLVGQKCSKHLPKGRGAKLLLDLMEKARPILEHHEINRVRIDLGENPANLIWPWGQGKPPKLPAFKDRYGMGGAVFSTAELARGLGKAVGLAAVDGIERALGEHDFVFAYVEFDEEIYRTSSLKSKLKLIEDFDTSVAGAAARSLEEHRDLRIAITTDTVWSVRKHARQRGAVPVLLVGRGIEGRPGNLFSERAAAQSKIVFEEGFKLMDCLLKEGSGPFA